MKCIECNKDIPVTRICRRSITKYCSKSCCNRAGQRFSTKRSREWFEVQKDKPCMDCGRKFPRWCMDFDHRPGEQKEFYLGRAKCISLEKRQEEIAKCDLVCACCHRTRTRNRLLSLG